MLVALGRACKAEETLGRATILVAPFEVIMTKVMGRMVGTVRIKIGGVLGGRFIFDT
jgi:hypothetical protein